MWLAGWVLRQQQPPHGTTVYVEALLLMGAKRQRVGHCQRGCDFLFCACVLFVVVVVDKLSPDWSALCLFCLVILSLYGVLLLQHTGWRAFLYRLPLSYPGAKVRLRCAKHIHSHAAHTCLGYALWLAGRACCLELGMQWCTHTCTVLVPSLTAAACCCACGNQHKA